MSQHILSPPPPARRSRVYQGQRDHGSAGEAHPLRAPLPDHCHKSAKQGTMFCSQGPWSGRASTSGIDTDGSCTRLCRSVNLGKLPLQTTAKIQQNSAMSGLSLRPKIPLSSTHAPRKTMRFQTDRLVSCEMGQVGVKKEGASRLHC